MHLGKIDNQIRSEEIPTSIYIEPPKSVAAREKIIRNHGFLNEKGGIGFSVLFGVGVIPPESGKVDLKECMREEEIVETLDLLSLEKKYCGKVEMGLEKLLLLGNLHQFFLKSRQI